MSTGLSEGARNPSKLIGIHEIPSENRINCTKSNIMRTARLSFPIQSLGIVMLSAAGHTLLIKGFRSLGKLSESLRMHRKAVGKPSHRKARKT